MSTADMPFCIGSNPDISGFGIRFAVYAHTILGFVPALFAIRDETVTIAELQSLKMQSTTVLITAFAILISTIVQVVTHGVTNFNISVILNLGWMNNTNLFVYLLLYVYHKAEEAQKKTHTQVANIKVALKNSVFIIGSLHLSLMAIIGVWLWSRPHSFGDSSSCPLSTSVMILGHRVALESPGLRSWSILIYSLLLIPVVNLVVPIAFFSVPYLIFRRTSSSPFRDSTNISSVAAGLIALATFNIILVADTEATLKTIGAGDGKWTFGQTLALLLVVVPVRGLWRTLRERRPREILLGAREKGNMGDIKLSPELGADAKDRDSYIALHPAANNGHVKHLVARGADGNVKSEKYARFDRSSSDGRSTLLATDEGHEDVVAHRADVNAKYHGGQAAPLLAADSGHTDLAQPLIEHGADVNAKDQTALFPAADKGHMNLAKTQGRADANATDDHQEMAP